MLSISIFPSSSVQAGDPKQQLKAEFSATLAKLAPQCLPFLDTLVDMSLTLYHGAKIAHIEKNDPKAGKITLYFNDKAALGGIGAGIVFNS